MTNKSISNRMQEFVAYHRDGDGECNGVVLKTWADKHNLDLQQRYELAYFFSVTYCVESAIILFEEQKNPQWCVTFLSGHIKPLLVFQSDRKYMRMKDSFERCMEFWGQIQDGSSFVKKVCNPSGKEIKLELAIKYVETWPMFGRFSAFLFLETFVRLSGFAIENTTIDWDHGDTATSGLLNLFGFDAEAQFYDKTGHLPAGMTKSKMDRMLGEVISQIHGYGGSENVTEIETSLCAYRKFYKGSRYNGYYLDRMLEEILKMKHNFPDVSSELLEIRSGCFDEKYLGEKNGWNGIRPKMKVLYRETGMIT